MRFILFFLLVFVTSLSFSQTPENPEDVSPLLIGEKISDINVFAVDGSEVSIQSVLRNQKTVLIFYRGGWCPYCNTHLSEMSKIEKDLIDLGYRIVAISPDAPENLKKSIDKNNLSYQLLSDKDGNLIRSMGLAFKAPTRYEKLLREGQGENSELILPVPAVFIVNEKQEILFEYINPNFKVRIKGDLLLSAAKIFSEQE